MNFWQFLRVIGSVAVLAISVLAVVFAMLRTPDYASESDTPANPPQRPLRQPSGTTGL